MTNLLNALPATTRQITKRNISKLESFTRLDVEDMTPERIRQIRDRENLSQTVLAVILNTSVSTIRKWESGAKHPCGTSLKLLNLIERKGVGIAL